jgi:signal transduction histidine kinase
MFVERAFERFSRPDTSRSGEGAGLGLALVNTIVIAHGGRVWIDDGARAGVHLWLPRASQSA